MHCRKFFDFGLLVIFPILGVFGEEFSVKHFCCGSTDVFRMFFNILIFGPNWRFCKGYSPCIIANFSNFETLLIFQILGIFGVDVCIEHFCCGSTDVLRMLLNFLIFDPNWLFYKGYRTYSLCILANFSDFRTLVFFKY